MSTAAISALFINFPWVGDRQWRGNERPWAWIRKARSSDWRSGHILLGMGPWPPCTCIPRLERVFLCPLCRFHPREAREILQILWLQASCHRRRQRAAGPAAYAGLGGRRDAHGRGDRAYAFEVDCCHQKGVEGLKFQCGRTFSSSRGVAAQVSSRSLNAVR